MNFYRYELVEYASDYEFSALHVPNPRLEVREFNLFKETPKGYWIGYGSLDGFHSSKKWVSKNGKKRYAYPTKEEALVNYIKRTEKRVKILDWQLQVAQTGLVIANRMKNEI